MLQRNDTGFELIASLHGKQVGIPAGETVDHPYPVASLTPVDEAGWPAEWPAAEPIDEPAPVEPDPSDEGSSEPDSQAGEHEDPSDETDTAPTDDAPEGTQS